MCQPLGSYGYESPLVVDMRSFKYSLMAKPTLECGLYNYPFPRFLPFLALKQRKV